VSRIGEIKVRIDLNTSIVEAKGQVTFSEYSHMATVAATSLVEI
jgi:hypothetical protein